VAGLIALVKQANLVPDIRSIGPARLEADHRTWAWQTTKAGTIQIRAFRGRLRARLQRHPTSSCGGRVPS
jgi:hypothetical protein